VSKELYSAARQTLLTIGQGIREPQIWFYFNVSASLNICG